MASIINAGTSGGLISTGDTSGQLQLQTAGTTALTVTSAQLVGVGTTSPLGTLGVVGSATTTIVIPCSSNGTTGSPVETQIIGSTYTNGSYGAGIYALNAFNSSSANWLTFKTTDTGNGSPVERMRITSAGNVGIGTTSPNAALTIQGAQTNLDTNIYATAVVRSSTAYNASPKSGLAFGVQYNTSGDYVYGSSIQCYKVTATNNDFGTGLRFTTQTNGAGPSINMTLDDGGNLLVGTTSLLSQTARLTVVSGGNAIVMQVPNGNTAFQTTNTSGTGSYYAAIWGNNGNTFSTCGYIQVSGTSTSYNTGSDYRLKEDVQPMTGALAKVALLKPVTYKWKADGSDGEGFIAHELAEVCPHAVSGEKDALKEDGSIMPQGIDTSFLVATLTAAIQELSTQLTELKAEVATLRGA